MTIDPLKFVERRCAVNPPRVMKAWEPCIIDLVDAKSMASQYFAPDEWGGPSAASCWINDDGRLRMFCADFANGRRLVTRHSKGGWNATFTTTPVRS